MTPEEKGQLLLRYLQQIPWAGVPRGFREVDLTGADLRHALLTGVDLSQASLRKSDLSNAVLVRVSFARSDLSEARLARAHATEALFSYARLDRARCAKANFSRCTMLGTSLVAADLTAARLRKVRLQDADLLGAHLVGADLSGADLRGARIDGGALLSAKSVADAYADRKTLDRSGWDKGTLRRLVSIGLRIEGVPRVFDALVAADQGLALYFDTRLHRLDPAAFDILITELFGEAAGVTVEQRSPAETDGPSFIRVHGKDPEQLASLAQAFYDRVWRVAAAEADRQALERVMSRGMGMVLERLDALRDGWNGATINHPTLAAVPAGAALVCTDPAARIANLHQAVAEENRVRALEQLILRLFAPGALHAWVEINYGVEVAAELPGPEASHAKVVAEAVRVWTRRGLIVAALFERLAAMEEGVAEAVRAVAGRWVS